MYFSKVKLEVLLQHKADFDERYEKLRHYFTDIRRNPEDLKDFNSYERLERLIVEQSNFNRQTAFRRNNILNISRVLERNSPLFNDYRVRANFKSGRQVVLQTLFGQPTFVKQVTPPRLFR